MGFFTLLFKQEEPIKNKEYFAHLYLHYKAERNTCAVKDNVPLEKHFYAFSIHGRLNNFDGKTKCDSAMAMFKSLNGHKNIAFTEPMLSALRDGNLGEITKECEEAGVLPEDFVNQEKEFIARTKEIEQIKADSIKKTI